MTTACNMTATRSFSCPLLRRQQRIRRLRGQATSAPEKSQAGQQTAQQPAAEAKQIISYKNATFQVEEQPILRSSWKDRAVVGTSAAAIFALFALGWSQSSSLSTGVISMLLGYLFADLGSGIYHWSVDNYGNGDTPLVGTQIAAFQGHHQRPWTITQREFCNNCSLTFKPAGAAAVTWLLAAQAFGTPGAWNIFSSTAMLFIALSQQFHAWSHMKKSQLPGAVVLLQDWNIIVSRKVHGAHHRSPFSINYSIVSGWTNPLLDGGLLLALEHAVRACNGVEPRAWSEPSEEWRELTPEEAARMQ